MKEFAPQIPEEKEDDLGEAWGVQEDLKTKEGVAKKAPNYRVMGEFPDNKLLVIYEAPQEQQSTNGWMLYYDGKAFMHGVGAWDDPRFENDRLKNYLMKCETEGVKPDSTVFANLEKGHFQEKERSAMQAAEAEKSLKRAISEALERGDYEAIARLAEEGKRLKG